MIFFYKFFLLELTERKIQEFINLHQGGLSEKEYSLNFTQLSKYAPTIVVDSREKMNKFVVEISSLVFNGCRLVMLIPSMDISHFMVHAKQIEEQKLKQLVRESNKSRSDDGNSSKARFEVQDKTKFKRMFSNQSHPNTQRVNKGKMSILKPQEGRGGGCYVEKPICTKFGKNHKGKFLVFMGNCYS